VHVCSTEAINWPGTYRSSVYIVTERVLPTLTARGSGVEVLKEILTLPLTNTGDQLSGPARGQIASHY
jgi:hypothetical protein